MKITDLKSTLFSSQTRRRYYSLTSHSQCIKSCRPRLPKGSIYIIYIDIYIIYVRVYNACIYIYTYFSLGISIYVCICIYVIIYICIIYVCICIYITIDTYIYISISLSTSTSISSTSISSSSMPFTIHQWTVDILYFPAKALQLDAVGATSVGLPGMRVFMVFITPAVLGHWDSLFASLNCWSSPWILCGPLLPTGLLLGLLMHGCCQLLFAASLTFLLIKELWEPGCRTST